MTGRQTPPVAHWLRAGAQLSDPYPRMRYGAAPCCGASSCLLPAERRGNGSGKRGRGVHPLGR